MIPLRLSPSSHAIRAPGPALSAMPARARRTVIEDPGPVTVRQSGRHDHSPGRRDFFCIRLCVISHRFDDLDTIGVDDHALDALTQRLFRRACRVAVGTKRFVDLALNFLRRHTGDRPGSPLLVLQQSWLT